MSWVKYQSDGFNSALSPVVYGDIVLSINTQYNTVISQDFIMAKHEYNKTTDVLVNYV